MRAGVLMNHRVCVSWFHYWDFLEQFPHVDHTRLVADRLFVMDGHRITCSGGRAWIDVAAELLKRHIDLSTSQKTLRLLLVYRSDTLNGPRPHTPGLGPSAHPLRQPTTVLLAHTLPHAAQTAT